MGLRSLYRESTSKNTWTALPIYRGHGNSQRFGPGWIELCCGSEVHIEKSIQLTEKDKPPEQGVMEESETTVFQRRYPKVSWPQRISACSVMIPNTSLSAGSRLKAAGRLVFAQDFVRNHRPVWRDLPRPHFEIPDLMTRGLFPARRVILEPPFKLMLCCTDWDTVTITLIAKLVTRYQLARDHSSSLTEEHDPVYLYGKGMCTQTHIQYVYIEQTQSIENDLIPNRLLPLSTVHPSIDFRFLCSRALSPFSKVCAIYIFIYISSDCGSNLTLDLPENPH